MSMFANNKDRLKEHTGMTLVVPTNVFTSTDPLLFWTNHPTENTLVDLHIFADGEGELNENSKKRGVWGGAYSGRPELIAELAPALQARLSLATELTCKNYKAALRRFWRFFDEFEQIESPSGHPNERVSSVKDLTHIHEAVMHQQKITAQSFSIFMATVNDARSLMRLGPVVWTPPSDPEPDRHLIPDGEAKEVRIAIKRDWEKVRSEWERNDAIMRGEEPDTLSEYEKENVDAVRKYAEEVEVLQRNWQHLKRIQLRTGNALPTPEQLQDGLPSLNAYTKLSTTTMRGIAFPTRREADIAFHMALAGCGWNPSTLIAGVDATLPERIFDHPKSDKQAVLILSEDEDIDLDEVTMQGKKRRAGNRLQFCSGLKKNPDSPPNIVAKYLGRSATLRKQLSLIVRVSEEEMDRLISSGAPQEKLQSKFLELQKLKQGLRNVWLYVDRRGTINWIDGKAWAVYSNSSKNGLIVSYLEQVIGKLNASRKVRKLPEIAVIVPSDFRDIYARWVHAQTGGNVLAVMFALGHAKLKSTDRYLQNNVFDAENDQQAKKVITYFIAELERGRVDLTILSHLVRYGELSQDKLTRLFEYRSMMRSRVQVACSDPTLPPRDISPDHAEGKLCGTQRCLRNCANARFLPESFDGIAMRVEELRAMSDHLPVETWVQGEYETELEAGEYLLHNLFEQIEVNAARSRWRAKIEAGLHVVPGVGFIRKMEQQCNTTIC